MTITDPILFAAAGVGQRLSAASSETLDMLDFGVVEMDIAGTVLRYNLTESRYSGLPPERVVGRNFFQQVAPCSNNQRVAMRYWQAVLDETIEYTFSLRMKPVPVTLRMIKDADALSMYLLVRWS